MNLFWLAAAFLVAWVFGYLVRPLLSKVGAYDVPNQRSSHQVPTLRGGGVSIVAAMLLCAGTVGTVTGAAVPLGILAAAFGVAVVSFFDDLKPLSASLRFVWQTAMATLAVSCVSEFSFSAVDLETISFLVASVFVVVGYTNVFNFMDGINGIAAGQALVAGGASALAFVFYTQNSLTAGLVLVLSAAGSAAGFLPHNFPRARMFMGDVGSATLGFVLAISIVSLGIEAGISCVPWLIMPHLNFLYDTGFTLLRRLLKGDKWYAAHREHFYQRWVRSGKSHSFVTGWEMCIQLVVTCAICVGLVFHWPWWSVWLFATLLWAAFFWRAEVAFRHSQSSACARSLPR